MRIGLFLSVTLLFATVVHAQIDAASASEYTFPAGPGPKEVEISPLTKTTLTAAVDGINLLVLRATPNGPASVQVVDSQNFASLFQTSVAIAASKAGVWMLIWTRRVTPTAVESHFLRSVDDGQTWQSVLRTPTVTGFIDNAIETDDAGHWVAAQGTRDMNGIITSIYTLSSTTDGVSWTPSASFSAQGDTPALATRNGLWVCAWRRLGSDTRPHMSTSDDGGLSWTPPRPVNLPQSGLRVPAVAVSADGRIVVGQAFILGPSLSISTRVTTTSDRGLTWSPSTSFQAGTANAILGGLASDDIGNVLIVLGTAAVGGQDVLASKLQAGSTTWTTPEFIDENNGVPETIDAVREIGRGDFAVVSSLVVNGSQFAGLVSTLDLYQLEGTDEDLILGTQVAMAGEAFDSVKPAMVGDTILIAMASPSGTFASGVAVFLGQMMPTGVLPTSRFPGIALDTSSSSPIMVLLDGQATAPSTLLLGVVTLNVPAGMSGYSLFVQGFTLAGFADNGIFAATNGHEIRIN